MPAPYGNYIWNNHEKNSSHNWNHNGYIFRSSAVFAQAGDGTG